MGGLARTLVASLVAVGAALAGSAAASAGAPDSVVGCTRRCSAPAAPASRALGRVQPAGRRPAGQVPVRRHGRARALGGPSRRELRAHRRLGGRRRGAGGRVPAGRVDGRARCRHHRHRRRGRRGDARHRRRRPRTGDPRRRAPSDGAERHVVSAAGGDTTVADFAGRWLVAGGGGGAIAAAEGRGWFGVGGAPGSASIRADRERFGARIDPLAKVGDGRLRLVYDQFDRDGRPSVVVRPVRWPHRRAPSTSRWCSASR